MEQILWAEADNGRDPKIIHRSFMEFHYRVHKSSALDPVLKQLNSEQHIASYSRYKITIVSSTGSSTLSFHSRFLIKNLLHIRFHNKMYKAIENKVNTLN
jgi:hypothetical protein